LYIFSGNNSCIKIHFVSTTDHCFKESWQLSAYANSKSKAGKFSKRAISLCIPRKSYFNVHRKVHKISREEMTKKRI